ncbi:hypothetical protein Gotri_016135, partial [Gossypium trilobum]|nr:hypothetical protein [Gossypium trilobum]
DCLIEQIRVSSTACSRRRYGNGSFNPTYNYNNSNSNNSNGNVRFTRKPVQRKRVGSEQRVSKRSGSVDDLKTVANNFKMEKVTILRRGESLDSKIKSNNGGGKEDGSLPLPSFSKKKHVPIDDSATRDLRRILRLDI